MTKSRKFCISVDDDLMSVCLFMQEHVRRDKVRAVARQLAMLAPVIWPDDVNEPHYAIITPVDCLNLETRDEGIPVEDYAALSEKYGKATVDDILAHYCSG